MFPLQKYWVRYERIVFIALQTTSQSFPLYLLFLPFSRVSEKKFNKNKPSAGLSGLRFRCLLFALCKVRKTFTRMCLIFRMLFFNSMKKHFRLFSTMSRTIRQCLGADNVSLSILSRRICRVCTDFHPYE